MINFKWTTRTLALAALLGSASLASAAESGFYVGVELGEAKYDVPAGPSGLFATSVTAREFNRDSAGALKVGYNFNSIIGVELSYNDYGSYRFSETGQGFSGTTTIPSAARDLESAGSGYGVAAVVALPVGGWDFFARVGGVYAKTELDVVVRSTTVAQINASESSSAFEAMYGLGLGYTAGEHYHFNVSWTAIPDFGDEDETVEADVEVVRLGFTYKF